MFGFALAPRYCLIDSNPWLIGIDPLRRYWFQLNGSVDQRVNVIGFQSNDEVTLRDAVQAFRALEVNESLELPTALEQETLMIHCISPNLYAIPGQVNQSEVWHLFDSEAIEAFLMTAHPDWICAEKDRALGYGALTGAWQQAIA